MLRSTNQISLLAIATLLLSLIACAQASTVSTVGAWPGVNLTWAQNPTGSVHYALENQNNSITAARTALANGNLPLLNNDLLGIQWALDRQVTNAPPMPAENAPGSIPGNTTGSLSHQAHSLLTFMAQLSEFTREVIASPYAAQYAAQTTLWKQRLVLTTNWIMRPDVNAASVAYNAPYAHRRFMAAAVLYATTYLNPALPNAAAINARADAYINDGFTCQFPAGTLAVQRAPGTLSDAESAQCNGDGFPAPAPILFPSGYTPNASWKTVVVTSVPSDSAGTFSLAGCTPEASGWDVAYLADAVNLAVYAAACCPDAGKVSALYGFCDRCLTWQQTRLIAGGTNISSLGCWRIGHEPSPNNPKVTKAIGLASIANGFTQMSVLSQDSGLRADWAQISARLRGKNAGTSNTPDAPTGLVVTDGMESATARWNETSSSDTYYVYLRQGGGVALRTNDTPLSDPTCVISGLTDGQTYLVSVSAVNTGGEGPRSPEVMFQPGETLSGTLPTAPTNPRVHPGNRYVRAIADPVGGALYYTLYVTVGNAPEFAIPKRLVSANYGLRDLSNGVSVTCVFTATNAAGEGPRSTPVTTTPTDIAP